MGLSCGALRWTFLASRPASPASGSAITTTATDHWSNELTQGPGRPVTILTSSSRHTVIHDKSNLPVIHPLAAHSIRQPKPSQVTSFRLTNLVRDCAIDNQRTMSTPVKSTPVQAAPVVDSPGTWRHPRLNEITRRRNATTFTEKNVRQIVYNIAALLALWSLRVVTKLQFNPQS